MGISIAVRLTAGDFHYADLEKLIRDHQVTTIEELLPLLPQDYRQFYTFIYESRSVQKDNVFPTFPRIVFYGADASFLIAVTKNPNTPPKVTIDDAIETIDFDEATNAFAFRRLSFHPGTSPVDPAPAVNPPLCLSCHGSDPRPNWDTYNVWPGVYGSVSRLNCDAMEPGTPELTHYLEFQKTNRSSERYQYVPKELTDFGSCPHDPAVEMTFVNATVTDPNADLSQKIFQLNLRRIQRLVRTSAAYSKYRFLWAALSRNCLSAENLESYFPPGFASQKGFPVYDDWVTQVVARAKAEFAQRLALFEKNNKGSAAEASRQPIDFMDDKDPLGGGFGHRFAVSWITLLANRMGLDQDRWSTAFEFGSLDYATPHSTPDEIYATWPVDTTLPTACEELRTGSVAALSGT